MLMIFFRFINYVFLSAGAELTLELYSQQNIIAAFQLRCTRHTNIIQVIYLDNEGKLYK